MTSPVRLQRKRTKGFDMQAESRAVNGLECVYVGRPTKWGNPFTGDNAVGLFKRWTAKGKMGIAEFYRKREVNHCYLHSDKVMMLRDIQTLRGKNLSCWCPLNQPCHADILLKLANGEQP